LKVNKLIAFVAHGFAVEDSPVVASVIETLGQSGVSVLTGERYEARGVNEKIKDRIAASGLFVALMTRRHYIEDAHAWTTSAWVIEEKGYSLGQNPNRPVLALVEEGISVPTDTGGLEGDLEIVWFNRGQFHIAEEKLRQALTHLMSKQTV